MKFAPAAQRLTVPSWLVGVLVIAGYFSTWGVVFTVIGWYGPLRELRWLLLAIAVGALGTALLSALARVRAREVAVTVATQMTSGAMLTAVVVADATRSSNRASIRHAYEVMPPGPAAAGFAIVGVLCAVELSLLARPLAERGNARPGVPVNLHAALGLAVVGTLLAAFSAAVLLSSIAAREAWQAIEWGGAIPVALLILQGSAALGMSRRLVATSDAAG